ncbi:MAG: cupin domain-containing protein [bacterium]|nr:cupin domain-containing protein [bacterium]
MNPSKGNLFDFQKSLSGNFEQFETIISQENITVERIISTGQKTPYNQWLEEDKNEWVVVLQGESEIVFENGIEFILKTGDYILIPKNTKHRVMHTSSDPACIWLAIHY